MTFFAHSADKRCGIPEQNYASHVRGVVSRATTAAESAARHSTFDGKLLCEVVRLAAEYHDLGKLDEDNQEVLSGKRKAKSLPVQHTDAGTAYLLDQLKCAMGAAIIRSHHIGLPDFVEEQNRGNACLRDDDVKNKVDATIDALIQRHHESIESKEDMVNSDREIQGNTSLFFRLALSCLADGDHTDTAIHYNEYSQDKTEIQLHPEKRLESLDRYVASLGKNDERSKLRAKVYSVCKGMEINGNIASCDSPVGTGKTTAIMAHLLTQAKKRNLRRIIVVLPFTNIISQSVETYRKAIVLPGEKPEEVVTELHHRAEFQDVHSRQFTALWKAPIIVTTAVNFFETLASNTPATLRRLHNLPGSALFIDESHAALPAKLLPLAWQWMKSYAEDWGCYWVLASGSLNRFWKIEEFDDKKPDVQEIVPETLKHKLIRYEKNRVQYELKKECFNPQQLVKWVSTLPGPRIVILNTVQSAATIAVEYEKKYGRENIEHLSTSLTPIDRTKTLERIKERLVNKKDVNWTLIATSCVEAGVDISFCSGVREAASLVSLLQIAGRVNRHGRNDNATVWTICLSEEGLLKHHPGMKDSSKVLLELFNNSDTISPELCTDALKREIRLSGGFTRQISKYEKNMQFPKVENDFRVISSDTRTVVIDKDIISRIEKHETVNWQEIQLSSVQIWGYRLEAMNIPEINGRTGIYKWTYEYDDFIGYMKGVFPVIEMGIKGYQIL